MCTHVYRWVKKERCRCVRGGGQLLIKEPLVFCTSFEVSCGPVALFGALGGASLKSVLHYSHACICLDLCLEIRR